MFEQKKYCPVCHELAAVLDGDANKYGDRAMSWNRFIATKYCSDECRRIMNGQNRRLADKRYRKRQRAFRETAIDAINALQERVKLLEQENALFRQRIAELKEERL